MSSLLGTLGGGHGFVKAGALGFGGSGKTFTSMLLAVAIRRHFKLEGPIAMADTEGGSEYIAPHVKTLTGVPLLGRRTRVFDDLVAMGEECVAQGVSVFIADSVTHYWRELCDAYIKQLNEHLRARRLTPRQRLEFQDWAKVKNLWSRWTDFYVNSPLHIIICGRAGYEYDMTLNEETGKKELEKTGVKMKTEGEFGYEPSLLFEMEQEQESDGHGSFRVVRQATVKKDRFNIIDGLSMKLGERDLQKALEQTWTFFAPHVQLLTPGTHAPIDTDPRTKTGVDEAGDDDWSRERRAREILCEEIQGELTSAWPGQSAQEKKIKTDLVAEIFGTRSWTQVQSMKSNDLRKGLVALKERVRAERGDEAPPPERRREAEPAPAASGAANGAPAPAASLADF